MCHLLIYELLCFFFFFQAEDGIRDKLVTGVQTCALPILSLGRNGIRDHGFQILRGPLPTLFLEVRNIRREELRQNAVRRDLERRQLLFRSGVGIHSNHRAVVELVGRVRRVTPEQPYVGRFAEVPRQTREVAVGIPDQSRYQRTVLEMFAQRVHELVILEIGQKNLERGARSSNEGLDRGVVILTPAARMDKVEGHRGRGPDEVVEPLNESSEGSDAQDPERRAHFRRFDPSNECLTTLSGTWSPCRTVNTAFRRNPRSSSTTRWLLSRAIRQARDALGAPPPITARAAVTTCSGGSAIVASCAQGAQRRDGCSRSAVHTCRPQ